MRHRIVAINFDHMHMGDLLRMVLQHPQAELVGVWHETPDKPLDVLRTLGLPRQLLFDDWRAGVEQSKPGVAILCPATADHALWVQRLASYGLDMLMEKPFAASLADADAMIQAVDAAGCRLAINWPLAWYPAHRTTKRLIDEGRIGSILNIHYYDGNRGPLHHKMDKTEVTGDELVREKQNSWFYRRASGGGSLLDYLGYGTTLATWFNGGQCPREVSCMVDEPPGLEVDEHSVTVARYASGLYTFQTRWGAFTDPWTHQPQPQCGFVVCGDGGTISSYDFEPTVRLQTRQDPRGQALEVDQLQSPLSNPVEYFLDCIARDEPVAGPLSVAISRVGQQIVDAAQASAAQKRTVTV